MESLPEPLPTTDLRKVEEGGSEGGWRGREGERERGREGERGKEGGREKGCESQIRRRGEGEERKRMERKYMHMQSNFFIHYF
jgi:hypothetical protein